MHCPWVTIGSEYRGGGGGQNGTAAARYNYVFKDLFLNILKEFI